MEIAASIVGLLSAGAKISQAMERFIQSTANAPSLAQTVKEEMNATSFILSKLHNLDLGPTSTFADRESLANTVAGCEATFSELEEHTQRLTASDKMDIRDRIYWAWAESTLKPLIHRLQQHKASLTLILILLKNDTSTTLVPYTSPVEQSDSLSPDIGPSMMKRPTFETTLLLTGPYRRIKRSETELSCLTFDRPIRRWSFCSVGSNTGVVSMPSYSAGSPSPDTPGTADSERSRGMMSVLASGETPVAGTPGVQVSGEDEGSWWVDLNHGTGWWGDETSTLVSGRDAEDEGEERPGQDLRNNDEDGSACVKEVQVAPQWP